MENEKRLIDANALTNEIIFVKKCLASEDKAGEWAKGYRSGLLASLEEIYQQPTVDAVEVVHGRWEQVGDYYVCGDYCYRCTNCMTDEWMTFGHMKRFIYCPYCGAKMDGGNEDG